MSNNNDDEGVLLVNFFDGLPWEVVGATFDPSSRYNTQCGPAPGFLGGIGPNGCGGQQGDTYV